MHSTVVPNADAPEIVGVIRHWALVTHWGRLHCKGTLLHDSKDRFPDGSVITTSQIIAGPDENGIIRTQNSFYQLSPYKPGDMSRDE